MNTVIKMSEEICGLVKSFGISDVMGFGFSVVAAGFILLTVALFMQFVQDDEKNNG